MKEKIIQNTMFRFWSAPPPPPPPPPPDLLAMLFATPPTASTVMCCLWGQMRLIRLGIWCCYNKYFVMGETAEQILQKLNKKIKKDYQDVGKNFAREARKAQKGKRDQKFYGKPTKEETNKLLDEGIDLFAVPDYKDK